MLVGGLGLYGDSAEVLGAEDLDVGTQSSE